MRQPPAKRPYLLRAMHQWMTDCGHTPHVIVDAEHNGVDVPRAYVKDGKIVLNLSGSATQHLKLGNEWIEFDARFAGVVNRVSFPISAVLGIYARETGEGMVFPFGGDCGFIGGILLAPATPELLDGYPAYRSARGG